ncbi:PD-(D/E)XK nuclease family protein [Crocosphaera sp. XPORK-15E]|uniref:PD-(D/E)XK nuclease family protein n=1 Tax=Crocosphaera sp. XPORK-15E TaxID=3110247 RepID=UPI002B2150E5|nr:DUF3782 domain-containing protein [Crocosphaera sp. XPORK-15E]MEA5536435.1 DUF3782 domain-containing protein [Crocosphaera sp. XPORK-15E]
MTEPDIKAIIQEELPKILQDREMRDFVLRTVNDFYAGKQETESRFDQILAELRQDREEQRRKWDEQNRKWDENNQRWEETQNEIKAMNRKHDSTIGALGARWGIYSEGSFRNALQGILKDSFGVEVVNVIEYDDQGEVFGRPDQIELDLLIKNGLLIICEIKSSMSKPDIYTFEKKVQFYQNRHQRIANRKIVISPMVNPRASEIARELGIEVYSYAEDVPNFS